MLDAAIMVVFPICLAYAAVSDFLTMTIPNRVPVIMLGCFALVAIATGMGWSAIGGHVLSGLTVLAAGFVLFGLGVMGGGDAKLLATASVWIGFDPLLWDFMISVAVFGGVLTMGILVIRGARFAPIMGYFPFARHLVDPKQGVPYGIAIGIAGLIIYPKTEFMQQAIGHLL